MRPGGRGKSVSSACTWRAVVVASEDLRQQSGQSMPFNDWLDPEVHQARNGWLPDGKRRHSGVRGEGRHGVQVALFHGPMVTANVLCTDVSTARITVCRVVLRDAVAARKRSRRRGSRQCWVGWFIAQGGESQSACAPVDRMARSRLAARLLAAHRRGISGVVGAGEVGVAHGGGGGGAEHLGQHGWWHLADELPPRACSSCRIRCDSQHLTADNLHYVRYRRKPLLPRVEQPEAREPVARAVL